MILFKVAGQDYESHVSPEYIIKGNDVLMKCGIPSFVADFVQVIGWLEESTNQELFPSDKSMGTFISHLFNIEWGTHAKLLNNQLILIK